MARLACAQPAQQKDATNGYMSTRDLAKCVAQAHAKGWDAVVMVWEVRYTVVQSQLGLTYSMRMRHQSGSPVSDKTS
ncbi:hypothetical protein V8E55_003138 [Tylopilus felleus]